MLTKAIKLFSTNPINISSSGFTEIGKKKLKSVWNLGEQWIVKNPEKNGVRGFTTFISIYNKMVIQTMYYEHRFRHIDL